MSQTPHIRKLALSVALQTPAAAKSLLKRSLFPNSQMPQTFILCQRFHVYLIWFLTVLWLTFVKWKPMSSSFKPFFLFWLLLISKNHFLSDYVINWQDRMLNNDSDQWLQSRVLSLRARLSWSAWISLVQVCSEYWADLQYSHCRNPSLRQYPTQTCGKVDDGSRCSVWDLV